MKIRGLGGGRAAAERGSGLVAAVVVVSTLAIIAGAGLTFQIRRKSESSSAKNQLGALYLAEAGISEGIVALRTAVELDEDVPKSLGSMDDPMNRRNGEYWARIEDNGDETYTITANGVLGRSQRAVEVIVRPVADSVFDHALFAGNASGDSNYELRVSGTGGQADEINGDLYSAGDVGVYGDADVSGSIEVGGTITGATGTENVTRPGFDVDAMDYENTADYDVGRMFDSDASWTYSNYGGSAWQLPESSPAHILRKNPSDRGTESSSTEKDDYFLEDPYETRRTDGSQNGSDASEITLSGTRGNPGENGNDSVYYIDGNLWVHNKNVLSFKMAGDAGEGARATFVVRGSIYFSDNLFYNSNDDDGVAFIAITDDDVDDSGNIYFGGPAYGTLRAMSAFMYAENDFYDYNLDASGSSSVTVNGNMTAGNHVAVTRDYVATNGDVAHSKLSINFDARLALGDLEMPGIPSFGTDPQYKVAAWREVAIEREGWEDEGVDPDAGQEVEGEEVDPGSEQDPGDGGVDSGGSGDTGTDSGGGTDGTYDGRRRRRR